MMPAEPVAITTMVRSHRVVRGAVLANGSPSVKGILLLFAALLPALAYGVIEVDQLSSEELSQRYRGLIAKYRCPKCQNQNLAESDAPLSADLRKQIRTMLEEGASNRLIDQYMVDRYGDFVLYRPPVQSNTYLLWLAPAALTGVAALVIVVMLRRQRRGRGEQSTLSEQDSQTLDKLLKQSRRGEKSE